MPAQPKTLSFANRVGIASTTLKAGPSLHASVCRRALLTQSPVTAASARLWTSPFKGQHGAHNYFKDVVFQLMRTQLGNLNIDQETYSRVPTTEAYLSFCKDRGITPESVTLSSGTQAHWLGNSNAKSVFLWLHGAIKGPCTPAWTDKQQAVVMSWLEVPVTSLIWST